MFAAVGGQAFKARLPRRPRLLQVANPHDVPTEAVLTLAARVREQTPAEHALGIHHSPLPR